MSESQQDRMRTIAQTNAMIRAVLEQETLGYPIWVAGIVKRHFMSDMGHVYFDLEDDDHTISCMIRHSMRGTIDFNIANGIEMEVFGTIRVYEKRAQVQIDVEKARLITRPPYVMDKSTLERLEKEGWFPKNKLSLPDTIKKIGLITSRHSEALHDFENNYRKEGGTAAIKLVDVLIQGQQAAQQVANAIARLNQEAEVDVIAIVRGGGRAAELAVFNDYLIAAAICRSTLPVVTGIGHERDETFADLVADVTTSTPTAAAVLLARQGRAEKALSAPEKPPIAQPNRWNTVLITALVVVVIILVILVVISTSRP
jgi:exodeoxyribonuclease VII large subunit